MAEITVPVTFEMTETGKEVLRNEILKILQEPGVLKTLLEALEKRLVQDIRTKTGAK